jgi:Ca-activated chloride channel family protein
MGNYNDVLLEQLADRGDGNYFYVDDLSEARRVLVDGLTGTLLTVAEDAKVQVAFDPARVLRYRLLGFENRDVADRDFRNDRVDAGEVGPGHEVTALYEVKLAPGAREGRLATVRVRYARPREEAGGRRDVREIAAVLDSRQLCRRFESTSPLFRLDAAAAEFAEILRGSYWAKESRPADVIPVARRAAEDLRRASWGGVDPHAADAAAELVSMLEQASRLQEQLSRNEEE